MDSTGCHRKIELKLVCPVMSKISGESYWWKKYTCLFFLLVFRRDLIASTELASWNVNLVYASSQHENEIYCWDQAEFINFDIKSRKQKSDFTVDKNEVKLKRFLYGDASCCQCFLVFLLRNYFTLFIFAAIESTLMSEKYFLLWTNLI